MQATGVLTRAVASSSPGGGPPVEISREDAQEAARRELTKGMYHENDPGWLRRTIDAVWDRLNSLLDSASGATPGGTTGLVAVALLVAALLGLLWWRLGSVRRGPATKASGALFEETARTAADHRRRAESCAANGDWNQAVQERMRALVRALEERTVLEARPGRTADEAAADAGRLLPAYAVRLAAAARSFDDVTYGGRDADRSSYEELTGLDREVERAKPDLAAASTPGWEAIR